MKKLFLLSVLFFSALAKVQTKPVEDNGRAFFKGVARNLLEGGAADSHDKESTKDDIADALVDIMEEDCESVCPPTEEEDSGANMIQCIQCIAEEFGTPVFPEFLESVLAIRSPEFILEPEEELEEEESEESELESDESEESVDEKEVSKVEQSEEGKEPEESEESEEEESTEVELDETVGGEGLGDSIELDEFVGDASELLEDLTRAFEDSGVALFSALLGPCKVGCSSVAEPQSDPLPCLKCMADHIVDESAQFISSALASLSA